MGSTIEIKKNGSKIENMIISDGMAAVFLNIICLNGYERAKYDYEKKIILWLMEIDRFVGVGSIGFIINEMPWNMKDFQKQKQFLNEILDDSVKKKNWDKQYYKPFEELTIMKLEEFRRLINEMEYELCDNRVIREWERKLDYSKIENWDKIECKVHGKELTELGWVIMNEPY